MDQIIFLGDYFDPKSRFALSAAETALFIQRLPEDYGEKFTFLLGNHDLPYLYDIQNPELPPNEFRSEYICSGYDSLRSHEIRENLEASFVRRLKPFHFVHDHLLSHAGLHCSMIARNESVTIDELRKLEDELVSATLNLSIPPFPPLASVGYVRGGRDEVGGILWQDWNYEFEDSLPWPQIVGHTIQIKPNQIGRSWNIDTRAGHYAILTTQGVEIQAEEK